MVDQFQFTLNMTGRLLLVEPLNNHPSGQNLSNLLEEIEHLKEILDSLKRNTIMKLYGESVSKKVSDLKIWLGNRIVCDRKGSDWNEETQAFVNSAGAEKIFKCPMIRIMALMKDGTTR